MAEEQQWIQQLTKVEDAATKAACQHATQPVVQVPPPAPIQVDDDAPTEPATSPRQVDPQAREWPVQLQPTQGRDRRVFGPQEEPERYPTGPTRFVMNDGQWTAEEHEEELRRAAQTVSNRQWN